MAVFTVADRITSPQDQIKSFSQAVQCVTWSSLADGVCQMEL